MKKVLLLVAGDNGTIGSCSLNLYEAMKAVPDIEVLCAVIHKFKDGYTGFSDARYFELESGGGIRQQIKWLKKIKAEFCPDVTVSTLFGVSTVSILSGGNDRKVGIFHSPYFQAKAHGKLRYMATLLQYSLLYPRLDSLCCVSQEVKDSLSAFPLIKDSKKHVVYNVHNLSRIIEKAQAPITDNNEKEIFSHPCLVYCGRLDRNKAPIRAVDAFASAEKPEDARLVFIGEDQQNLVSELKAKAEKLGIADRIYFFGRKSNPYPYFKEANALISTSYSEGLPGVMIEALALGTPVVTTNSSKGIWEIFSCVEDYDSRLDTIFRNECGIISSNLSAADSSLYDTDIRNLADAIGRIWSHGPVSNFMFADNVKGDRIVAQLLRERSLKFRGRILRNAL